MTSRLSRWLLAHAGWFARGSTLHRAALAAAHAGHARQASVLLERAARAYRRDLEVAALARLRVHESILEARRTTPESNGDPESDADVDRRLARLSEIESLEPPFQCVPAVDLIASWRAGAGAEPHLPFRHAA